MIFPGVGTVIGAVVGAAAGAAIGWYGGGLLREAVGRGGYWSLYQNATQKISDAYIGHIWGAYGGGVMGGNLNGHGYTYYNYDGWIGEIVVSNRALNATELQQVQTYLRAKWGTPSIPQRRGDGRRPALPTALLPTRGSGPALAAGLKRQRSAGAHRRATNDRSAHCTRGKRRGSIEEACHAIP